MALEENTTEQPSPLWGDISSLLHQKQEVWDELKKKRGTERQTFTIVQDSATTEALRILYDFERQSLESLQYWVLGEAISYH